MKRPVRLPPRWQRAVDQVQREQARTDHLSAELGAGLEQLRAGLAAGWSESDSAMLEQLERIVSRSE